MAELVDCTGLENRHTERYLGFESLSLRNPQIHLVIWGFLFIFDYGKDRN